LHPKKKVASLSEEDRERLFETLLSTLGEMTTLGGRDTENDLFGKAGKYPTQMSKNTVGKLCPVCGGIICKENYMGGSIYYCPGCQKPE
jgi:formamidopyrimidine-DNA glycosylase